jgi:hypothetical protein
MLRYEALYLYAALETIPEAVFLDSSRVEHFVLGCSNRKVIRNPSNRRMGGRGFALKYLFA